MRIFGIAGWSGSGKTTLLRRLLPELTARGPKVATMKYTHHQFDLFPPDHEVTAWRDAGAQEVLYVSDRRWALLHELDGKPEPTLEDLYEQYSDVDLLLIEGFKRHPHAKLEVHRAQTGVPLLATEDDWVVAVASDSGRPESLPRNHDIVLLDLNDIPSIANFVIAHCGLMTGGMAEKRAEQS